MKSTNIITEYTQYIEKNIKKVTKLVLSKNYSEEDFSDLLDIYIKARYYDSLKRKSKSPYFNTKLYIKDKILKLKESGVKEPILKIYEEILNIDQNNLKAKDLLNNIKIIRDELKLTKSIDEEIIQIYDEIDKKRQEIQKAFKSKDFSCKYTATNIRKVYDVYLDYSFSIPKLYSEYAINKVYMSSVVGEDKLYVEYYIITHKLLNEIIAFDFSNNYLIDFVPSIIEKSTKFNKLLSIISNDVCKEKLSLKLSFSDYEQNKDKIMELINNGYNFAVAIDDTYVDTVENKKIISSIFKYVIIRGDVNPGLFKECKNLIRVK